MADSSKMQISNGLLIVIAVLLAPTSYLSIRQIWEIHKIEEKAEEAKQEQEAADQQLRQYQEQAQAAADAATAAQYRKSAREEMIRQLTGGASVSRYGNADEVKIINEVVGELRAGNDSPTNLQAAKAAKSNIQARAAAAVKILQN